MIHPVSTSIPSSVRHRSRNGLAGIGVTAKQPISSIGELALNHPAAITNMIHVNANGTETVTLYTAANGAF